MIIADWAGNNKAVIDGWNTFSRNRGNLKLFITPRLARIKNKPQINEVPALSSAADWIAHVR